MNIREQISRRCIHFTGIQNKECSIGVKYEDVRIDRPYKFPCLNGCDTCSKREFPSQEQISMKVAEIEKDSSEALAVYANVKSQSQGGNFKGEVNCPCGGKLTYDTAFNGRVRAKCFSCGLYFAE